MLWRRRRSVPEISSKEIFTLCIIRLSSIGDVCHVIPSVQCIQKKYPLARITWIINKTEWQLVKDMPSIRFIVIDKSKPFIKTAYYLRSQLAEERYDFFFQMQDSIRSSLLGSLVKARYRVGFHPDYSREGQIFFVNHYVNKPRHSLHVVDVYMEFARLLQIHPSQVEWDISFFQFDNSLLTLFRSLPPVILINPCASNLERNWLVNCYERVIKYLLDRGYAVFLTGGPDDTVNPEVQILGNIQHKFFYNFIGKLELGQLLTCIKYSKLVVAPDTGPIHMATMVGTPTIALHAHANPSFTGPYNRPEDVISIYEEAIQEQTNSSLTKLKPYTRAKGRHLMSRITPEMVFHKINDKLSSLATDSFSRNTQYQVQKNTQDASGGFKKAPHDASLQYDPKINSDNAQAYMVLID